MLCELDGEETFRASQGEKKIIREMTRVMES